jgi:U3 small nucleolar RNA-associated protein MPP10
VDLISSLSPFQAPRTRSQTKLQAHGETQYEVIEPHFFQPTPLSNLFTNGMEDEQIWAQLDLRTQTICRTLDYVLEGEVVSPDLLSNLEDSAEDNPDEDEGLQKVLEALKREDIDMDEFLGQYSLDENDLDDSQDEDLEEPSSESDSGDEEMQEDISPLHDPSSDEEENGHHRSSKTSRKRKRGVLSDGFFDLAEFNAHTERAEARSSSRGPPHGDDSDNDDQEIDFFANVDSNADLGDDEKAGEGMYYHSRRDAR